MEDRIARFRRQVFPRCVSVEGQLLGKLFEQRVVFNDEIFSADTPGFERAAAHRFFWISDDQLRHEAQFPSESAAGAARAVTVVEGKMARGEFLENIAA